MSEQQCSEDEEQPRTSHRRSGSNGTLDRSGEPVVLGFGLAKQTIGGSRASAVIPGADVRPIGLRRLTELGSTPEIELFGFGERVGIGYSVYERIRIK